MSDKDRLIELVDKAKEEYANDITDYTETDYIVETLLNEGVIVPTVKVGQTVYVPGGARKLMVEAPTADVVKVVRCKDCEFAKPQALKLNGKELRKCDLHKRPCFLTDFCNYGVLKEREGE